MEAPLFLRYSRVFKVVNVSVHAIGAVQFWFGCYYDWFHVNVPKEVLPIFSAFGYKLKFLTYWDVILQSVYFTLCLGVDIWDLCSGSQDPKEPRRLILRIKDFIYASFAFPIAMFVGVTFWALMAVDRELVLPAVLDPYFPSWLNHIVHTNIVIWQALETITASREYPPRKFGIPALFMFQACYLIWMYVVYSQSGLWVYPIFDVLSTPLRILFLSGCFVAGFIFYYMGERINSCLWEEKRELPTHQHVKYSR